MAGVCKKSRSPVPWSTRTSATAVPIPCGDCRASSCTLPACLLDGKQNDACQLVESASIACQCETSPSTLERSAQLVGYCEISRASWLCRQSCHSSTELRSIGLRQSVSGNARRRAACQVHANCSLPCSVTPSTCPRCMA